MNTNLYERYAKLRDLKGFSDYRVANDTGIGTPTISNWKNGKYQPKDDKMKLIADMLDVTVEFLRGDTDLLICPTCGFGNNPLSEQSRMEHENFHKRFLEIKEEYPFFMAFSEASIEKSDRILEFRNSQKTIEGKIEAFEKYLEAAFSLEICQNNYDIEHLDYEQFCKVEVGTLEPDHTISKELIEALVEKYGVDKAYIIGNEQLLARVSNNRQLMRIMAYAEKLNPNMLDSLEIQIKALAKNNSNEG